MVDVMDRRVTRSVSNEQLRARAAWPSQQSQLHQGLYNKSGSHEKQGNEDDLTYGRNTSEELYLDNLIHSAGPSAMEAASLAFMEDLQPPSTPANQQSPSAPRGQDSEELFHYWMNSTQVPNNGAGSASENARRSEHLDFPTLPSGSSWESLVNARDMSQYLTSDGAPDVNGGQKSYRRSTSREKAKAIANNLRKDGNSPVTRSQSAELLRRRQDEERQRSEATPGALPSLVPNGNVVGASSPAVTSAAMYAPAISKPEVTENGKEVNLRGQEVLLLPPLTSPVLNINQQAQQQKPTTLSSVVGLLKGSLERKKLQDKQQQKSQRADDWQQKGVRSQPTSVGQGKARQDELPTSTQGLKALDLRQQIQAESDLTLMGQLQPLQQTSVVVTQSPTGSYGAALSHSAGRVGSDGPSPSGLKRGAADMYENGTVMADNRKKADQLTRAGSINSSDKRGFRLNEIDGATKKRRVERQRKMAEAKGRGNAPPVPADLQEALKRCEEFQEEVRSLKLRLAFMNRKDSDQTKKIEELEQRNRELKKKNDNLSEKHSGLHY